MSQRDQELLALQPATTAKTDGSERMAYVKIIRSEDVAFLYREAPLLRPGHWIFALVAADGRPISLAETNALAHQEAAHRELQIVSLH